MHSKQNRGNKRRPAQYLLACISTIVLASGCDLFAEPKKSAGISSSPAGASSTPAAGSATGSANSSELPADLVQKVETLVALNDKYCEVAKQVQDAATFRQHIEELSNIDREAASASEDIMIAENKLTSSQKEALERDMFGPKAQPSIQRKNEAKKRVMSLAP